MGEAEEHRRRLLPEGFLGDRLAVLRHELERHAEGSLDDLLLAP
jgi:hypothetical protein